MMIRRVFGMFLLGLGIVFAAATLLWYAIPLIVIGANLAGFSIWRVIFRRRRKNHG